MQVKQVQKPQFETRDGKLFEDERAAKIHAVTIDVDERFESFMEGSGYAAKSYQCVLAWELNKEGLLPPRKSNGKPPETPEPSAAGTSGDGKNGDE